jgi:predicted TPR repeat methyltransferase
MDTSFEQARRFFLDGVGHYEAGRFADAERLFEASLSLVPQRASTLTNLGAARVRLGKFGAAAEVLEEASRLDPGDAQAWGHFATALAELGQHGRALDCAARALRLDAGLAAVWTLQGTLLRESGRDAEAAQSFRSAIAAGGDAELNAFFLAAVEGASLPAQAPPAPREYVQSLFDSYAEGFERHLTDVLRYQAPQILVEGLGQRRFESALDLGCGTGLGGECLQGHASRVVGVDISAGMVAQARSRGVYAEVLQADVLDFLSASRQVFDLVVAADVFIYLGDLGAVFSAVKGRLAPEGMFAFTVELASGKRDVELRPSLRYAHTRSAIESLARGNGFTIQAMAEHALREDQGTPIGGLFAWLANRP